MAPITFSKSKKIITAKYRQWSPTAMSNAMQIIREQNMSVRKAAKLYNVPLTTLRDRVDGRSSLETIKSGPEPLLSQEQEAKLVNYISYMASLGYGFSRTQVLEVATDLAVSLGKRDRNQPLSMYWFYDFLARWPELHVVKSRGLAAVRAQSATPNVIDKYFKELKSTLDKYNFFNKPQSIYNLDEKGISTEHHPPNIVAKRGLSSQSITSPRGANTTIIGCGNALGQQIPPYFIFAGKRMREELLNDCLPGTAGTVTDNGWSNSHVFEIYLRDHFQLYAHASPDNPILLLFDGHTSHITLPVIEWAKDMGIILFVLPPHTSHILQPLDIACFCPLQRIYNTECSKFLRNNPGQTISRINVCQLSCKAYSNALSPENLRSAFRKSGIYPFNPTAFDITKIAPSKTFEVENDKPTEINANTSPDVYTEQSVPADHTESTGSITDSFFQQKYASHIQSKPVKHKRKSVHPIVAGKEITNESVILEIKKYKQDTNKQSTVSTEVKQARPTKSKPTSADQPGPSKSNITYSNSDQPGSSSYSDSDYTDNEPDSSKCCVCKKNSPPGLHECNDLVIVKWCQCDKCNHWTHLRFCSTVRVVRRHSEFLCPCCK